MKFFIGSRDSLSKIFFVFLILVIFLNSCQAVPAVDPTPTFAHGEISKDQDTFGTYYLYRPTTPSNPPQTMVVIHGTPAKDLSAGETALYYAEHWALFAEEQGLESQISFEAIPGKGHSMLGLLPYSQNSLRE